MERILPPPTLLPPAGRCRQPRSAPSPAGFLLYPSEDAATGWQRFGTADALCMGPVWDPWHPLGARQTHHPHSTAPSPGEGPCGLSQLPTPLLLGDASALRVPAVLPTAVTPQCTEGPSTAFPAACREQHEGIWGQQRPRAEGGSENWVAPCTRHGQAARGLCSAAAPNPLCPQPVPCPRRAQH